MAEENLEEQNSEEENYEEGWEKSYYEKLSTPEAAETLGGLDYVVGVFLSLWEQLLNNLGYDQDKIDQAVENLDLLFFLVRINLLKGNGMSEDDLRNFLSDYYLNYREVEISDEEMSNYVEFFNASAQHIDFMQDYELEKLLRTAREQIQELKSNLENELDKILTNLEGFAESWDIGDLQAKTIKSLEGLNWSAIKLKANTGDDSSGQNSSKPKLPDEPCSDLAAPIPPPVDPSGNPAD